VNDSRKVKIAVVGVGNAVMGDEGIGVHVVDKLKSVELPPEVVVLDGGTHFWGDEAELNGSEKLIIIDAVLGGGAPATIYRFGLDELEDEAEDVKLSCHDIGLIEKLQMTRIAGSSPEQVVVIGVEPAKVELNTGLSREVEEKVPEIIDAVMAEITCSRTG